MLLEVTMLNSRGVIFEGMARSVTVPGEQGTFEVLPFHKRLLSRLVLGDIFIDEKAYSINRGIIKVDQNSVTIVAEGDIEP
jgi:F0F1-type ATP synthase epsilon subunit